MDFETWTREQFLRFASVSSPTFSERELADLLRTELEKLGFSVEEDRAVEALGGNCGNLYGFRPGERNCEPLLFTAHLDTVKPCDNKKILVDADGTIRSDGTTILGADDVTGIVELLAALHSCVEEGIPLRPVEVLLTVSEEYFLKGSEGFDYSRLRSKQVYVLDVDGAIGSAVISAPTGIRLIANLRGRAAHAALAPETGISAVQIAAAAIAEMRLGRIDADTTANIGIIQGGTSGNVVPESCMVEGETRSLVREKADAQCAHMCDCFRASAARFGGEAAFEITRVYEAYSTSEDSPVVRRFQTAVLAEGLKPRLIASCGGSDNSVFSTRGLMGIVVATGMHDIHSTAETTSVRELAAMARVVRRILTAEE